MPEYHQPNAYLPCGDPSCRCAGGHADPYGDERPRCCYDHLKTWERVQVRKHELLVDADRLLAEAKFHRIKARADADLARAGLTLPPAVEATVDAHQQRRPGSPLDPVRRQHAARQIHITHPRLAGRSAALEAFKRLADKQAAGEPIHWGQTWSEVVTDEVHPVYADALRALFGPDELEPHPDPEVEAARQLASEGIVDELDDWRTTYGLKGTTGRRPWPDLRPYLAGAIAALWVALLVRRARHA